MPKVLLCPPDYFDVLYEINPWMHMQIKVNPAKVRQEYETLKEAYLNLGLEILEIQPDPGLPDMVFATDFGVINKITFIPANYTFKERKPESLLTSKYLKEKGYSIATLPHECLFEGGDLVKLDDKKYFLGWGFRTLQETKTYLSSRLEADVVTLELANPYYFHLDTCFMPINKETVVIYPQGFTKESLTTIQSNFTHIIQTSTEDSRLFACNGVLYNSTLVIGSGISKTLKKTLESVGLTIIEVPMDEYKKGGGSVRCLSLFFN